MKGKVHREREEKGRNTLTNDKNLKRNKYGNTTESHGNISFFRNCTCSLKVRYRAHKRLPPDSVLSKINPVHSPILHFLKTILMSHLFLILSRELLLSDFCIKIL
jgi:hypothetical protein